MTITRELGLVFFTFLGRGHMNRGDAGAVTFFLRSLGCPILNPCILPTRLIRPMPSGGRLPAGALPSVRRHRQRVFGAQHGGRNGGQTAHRGANKGESEEAWFVGSNPSFAEGNGRDRQRGSRGRPAGERPGGQHGGRWSGRPWLCQTGLTRAEAQAEEPGRKRRRLGRTVQLGGGVCSCVYMSVPCCWTVL